MAKYSHAYGGVGAPVGLTVFKTAGGSLGAVPGGFDSHTPLPRTFVIDLCVSLPMILQVLQDYASLFALQNYASPDLYTKIHSSLSILLDLRHLPCNMKHLGKRPSQSSAMKAK
jgi:hypothetical protein